MFSDAGAERDFDWYSQVRLVTNKHFHQLCFKASPETSGSAGDFAKTAARIRCQLRATPRTHRPDSTSSNRPPLLLRNIANHIFWLRNASIHGGPIPTPGWLSNPHDPVESGYAYQLLECTEILLRESLLMLLEDRHRFEIFIDAHDLMRTSEERQTRLVCG